MYKALFLILVFNISFSVSAQKTGKKYRIDRYESIYLPLGKISFADSLVSFKMGTPKPIEKFSDPLQCLHEPDYKNYHTPNFTSIGCEGSITVAFTDNGFMNLLGRDLYVFEVGPSREPASVEISEDGLNWLDAGKISGGKSSIDLENQNIPKDVVYYYLRITDLKGMCRSKTAGADIDAIAAVNSVIKLTINADVLFDVAKFQLKEDAHNTLVTLSETIKKVDKATIRIEGHTDSDGEIEYNQTLSENRCLTVKDRIEALLGYEALYDYEIKAFGETKPKLENTTVENKKMNRRVEITVLPPKDFYKGLQLKK